MPWTSLAERRAKPLGNGTVTGWLVAVIAAGPAAGQRRASLLSDLTDQSNRDEQDGVHFLMAGVQAAIANVDKHADLGVDGPARAMEVLGMISFLARAVDRCRRVEP
jgi:hypothetical protein